MSTMRSGAGRYPQASSGAADLSNATAAIEPVQVGVWPDPRSWDEFVLRAADGTIAHRWAWLDIVAETYGHRTVPLAAVHGGRLAGVLPLVQMRSRLFGHHLVSMPFLDAGGLCTDGNRAADEALAGAAAELAERSGALLELRHLADRPISLVPSLHKIGLVLDLAGGEDAVWDRIDKVRRRQVRKAHRSGLVVSVHGSEALPEFNRILETNMRDLGSPPHRRGFARRIMRRFGQDARILLARDCGSVIGAGMVLSQGSWMGVPWLAALRSSFPRAPNQLLYWEAIRYAISCGCKVFDFGRSSPGTGPYESKLQWAAEPVQLYWHRLPGDEGGGDVQRWLWATKVWRHLPVPIATAAGTMIRGRLPQ
jgi:FemAB-related protein (PEP-CTERM system-associated)